jgi:hypothetical protein
MTEAEPSSETLCYLTKTGDDRKCLKYVTVCEEHHSICLLVQGDNRYPRNEAVYQAPNHYEHHSKPLRNTVLTSCCTDKSPGIQHNIKRNPKTIIYCGTKWNQKHIHPRVTLSPNPSRDTQVKVTLVARPLLSIVAQELCRCEHGVFTNRTSIHSRTLLNQNCLLLHVKHLAMLILTRKCRIKQQYTNW